MDEDIQLNLHNEFRRMHERLTADRAVMVASHLARAQSAPPTPAVPLMNSPAPRSCCFILAVMEQPRRMATDLALPDPGDSAGGPGRRPACRQAQRRGGSASAAGGWVGFTRLCGYAGCGNRAAMLEWPFARMRHLGIALGVGG
jgi:hypothetical protein